MELSEYNGWENKFTWLVHLHLSDDPALSQEVTMVVTSVTRHRVAARLLHGWVKASFFKWLGVRPEQAGEFALNMRLFAWDMVGSALAYTDWDALVTLLMRQTRKSKNAFTMTLLRYIRSDGQLQAFLFEMIQAYSNTYQCADVMHGWFREQADTFFAGPYALSQSGMAGLVHELLETTYRVVVWKHVARAFRPEY